MKNFQKIFATGSLAILFTPVTVLAQKSTLVSDKLFENGDLGGYFNKLFDITLTVGAVLAVIIIATAGIQYMVNTDSYSGKTRGKERIQQAVMGVLMLWQSICFLTQLILIF